MNAASNGDTIAIDEIYLNVENVVVPAASTLTFRPTTASSNCKTPAHPVGGRFHLEGTSLSQPALLIGTGANVTVHGGSIKGTSGTTGSAIEAINTVTLTVLNSDIEGTQAANGAGIRIGTGGALTVDGSRVFGGNASGNGGNIYAGGGTTLDLVDSTIELGVAGGYGGGVFVAASSPVRSVNLTDTTVRDNEAVYGGGLALNDVLLTLDDSTIDDNLAQQTDPLGNPSTGGGVFIDVGGVTMIDRSRIRDNSADYGGGLYITTPALSLNMSQENALFQTPEIRGNSALDGAGVMVDNGLYVPNTISGGWIRENTAIGDGGGIYVDGVSVGLVVAGTRLWDNIATRGAGIITRNVSLTLDGTEVLRNHADDGGGVHATSPGFLIIEESRIASNTASEDGGGIYVNGGETGGFMVDSTSDSCVSSGSPAGSFCTEIDGNKAERGGAFFIEEGDAVISRTAMRNNTADAEGETIAAVDSTVHLENTLIGQRSNSSGAGYIYLENTDATLNGVTMYSKQTSTSPLTYDDYGLPFDADSSSALTIEASIIATGGDVDMGGMSSIATECNLLHTVAGTTVLTGGPNRIGASFDPDFVDPSSDDYHLGSSSDALARCTTGLTDDLDGDPRNSAGYDMGALERP